MLDPGIAPLGTDDEAAGAPLDPKLVSEVRERERRDAPTPPDPAEHRMPIASSHQGSVIAVAILYLLLLTGVLSDGLRMRRVGLPDLSAPDRRVPFRR